MKKIVSFLTLASLCVMTFGPVLAVAETGTTNIGTSLNQDTTGGKNPIVKAKWEANTNKWSDDNMDVAGAQFNPSGVYNVNKTIALCAIVTDPDGLADIDHVYADVFYPVNVELGSSHVELGDQSGLGCGELMQEDSLTRLAKTTGYTLFCDTIRTNNPDLPTFNTVPTAYSYDEICGEEGELMKDTAAVYCTTKVLSYEDPAGDYKVWAVGQDKVGKTGKLENYFTYNPVTAFETDFTAINYGDVRLNTDKIISGDKTWAPLATGNLATVRNVGNTRLSMKVWQDDMGFGLTDGKYNVSYDARVGSLVPTAKYAPYVTTDLESDLDLSEVDEMDFSILVTKFPETHVGPYTGAMTLSAVAVPHLECLIER